MKCLEAADWITAALARETFAAEREARLRGAGSDVIRASNTLMLMLVGDIAMTKPSIEAAIRRALDARNEWDNARAVLGEQP